MIKKINKQSIIKIKLVAATLAKVVYFSLSFNLNVMQKISFILSIKFLLEEIENFFPMWIHMYQYLYTLSQLYLDIRLKNQFKQHKKASKHMYFRIVMCGVWNLDYILPR